MVFNQGFLVKNDRFSLTDEKIYYLFGWLVPGTDLTAELGGKPVPAEVIQLTDNVDERYGGCETKVIFRFEETLPPGKRLKVWSDGETGKKLCFTIRTAGLEEKRRGVRYYIDEYTVNRKDGFFRVQGWAAAREPVCVEVFGKDGKKLTDRVERYKRYDTVELFDEYPVDPDNGFNIELRPVPEGPVRVRLRTSEDTVVLTYPTDEAHVQVRKAGHLLGKARDAFLYNGMSALAAKTWNKLFNPAMRTVNYADWIGKHLPSERMLQAQRREPPVPAPLISIVVPCYRTPDKYLRELADSVKKQSYANWELILSDGSGPDSPISGLLDELEASDARIRTVRHGERLRIAENTNAAIREAKGEWIMFCDHDDLLVPSALYETAKAAAVHPEAELIYTDEDKIGTGDKLMQPNLKPDYDPDFLCSVNYICHLTSVRRELLERTGLLDPAFDGAQDYDFILRCTEQTDGIVHIPKILYHWRFFEGSTAANPESKLYAFEAGKRAIEAHYRRKNWPATVENGEFPGIYRTIWHWEEEPLVSVLIPNKDHIADLRKCLDSLDRCSDYPNIEIIIIENNSTEEETFAGYRELTDRDPRIRVITYEGGFNYSAINNFGVREAKGDYLLLLNNDTEFISDAVREMLGFCMRPDVGAVGARLYYGDDTIQHAGAIIGWGGVAGHAFVNQKRGVSGYQHRIICQQDYSAVTAACMMVRASVFREAGGFTEELAVAFNDIDLCMKIREKGYLIVYNPYAELYHYESKSRGLENTPEKKSRFGKELKYFEKKWPDILRDGDPYYNPNLSMITQDFSLKRS